MFFEEINALDLRKSTRFRTFFSGFPSVLPTQTINLASLSLLFLITVRRDVVDVVFIAMFSSTFCLARLSWQRVAPRVLGIPPAAPNAVLALSLLLRLQQRA